MATVTIELEPGEQVTLTVYCDDDGFWIDDDPDPAEEEPEEVREFPRAVGE